MRASGQGIVKLSTYGIDQPSQLGVRTTDEVKLKLELTARRSSSQGKRRWGRDDARAILCVRALGGDYGGAPGPAFALPTMIRSGYTNCAACHIAPQGGGLLNDYGRGIDQAQSLRGGEYQPADDGLFRTLSLQGRIRQDLRLVMQQQGKWDGRSSINAMRARLMYRTVAAISDSIRFAATVTGENESAARPKLSYEPPAAASHVFVNTALLHYRAGESVDIAVGRDQLPTGINIPDLGVFIKARNRLGYYDAPTQLKAVWGGQRFQVTPFVYAGGGNEPRREREHGAGSLAEFDVLGNQRTVLGMTVQRSSASNGERQLVGSYARLGFGRWGILAEHDVTTRTPRRSTPGAFRQDASYAQVFWAVRDWLVTSATGERLRVNAPYTEHLTAGKVEVASRLTSQATVIVGTRVEHNAVNRRLSRSLGGTDRTQDDRLSPSRCILRHDETHLVR